MAKLSYCSVPGCELACKHKSGGLCFSKKRCANKVKIKINSAEYLQQEYLRVIHYQNEEILRLLKEKEK